jgi:hypothetical protein
MPAAVIHSTARCFALATLLISAVLPAAAQSSDDKSPKVSFRVTRFDPADRASPKFHVGSGESKVEIEVPLTHIAGPFKGTLRDGVFLDLWGGATEKPAISLEVKPSERDHLLLVFFPDGESFKVMKITASPERIKGGDRFIINTTPNEVAIKLGDAEPVVIPSAKTGLLSGPQTRRVVSLPVVINLKQDGAWKLASTEDWPCDPRFRKYLIAYMSPRSRQLVFHSLSELSQQP